MLEVTESGIYATCVLKDYGTHQVMIYYKNNVRKKGYEEIKDDEDVYNEKYNDCDIVIDESYIERLKNCVEEQTEEQKNEWDRIRSIRRSKDLVKAIGNMNDWDYFFTGTFDKEKVGDRKDLEKLKKSTLEFFKNQSKKYGIKYLLIPELHKDGALHWHGLIRDVNDQLKLTDSRKKYNGRIIYNMDSWNKYKGFNTCVEIGKEDDDKMAVSNYITKYISKNDERIFDKYYYSSQGLVNHPKISYLEFNELPIDFFDDNVYENPICYMKTIRKENKE
ncbi:rolling circle replication-associated protein [Faecalibacillus intestinalis]|uniref:rolling circle replication-associated protein n=1 Tax=Faecalibacillus intestinalis TaxID=1982626 RepID=UPI003AB1DA2F